MRRFWMLRNGDCVAEGVEFGVGGPRESPAVLHWITSVASTALYKSMDELMKIHGHPGTEFKFQDPICFRCGAHLMLCEIESRLCAACCAGQGKELFFEAKPNPSLGVWTPALTIGGEEKPAKKRPAAKRKAGRKG